MLIRSGVGIMLVCAVFCAPSTERAQGEPFETVVVTQEVNAAAQPMKLFIGCIGEGSRSNQGKEFSADLERYCAWSGRFAVTVEHLNTAPKKKKDVQNLFKALYDCALFVTYDGPNKPVEWRLYDTSTGEMIEGKRAHGEGGGAPCARLLAEVVLRLLTGEPQPFFSKLAYRKRDKRGHSHLMIADFDGSNATTMLQSKRIIVAPKWNNDPECPMLLFSEFTPDNVRLVMGDLSGRCVVVLDVEGTTVGVSYAQLSDDVVYCRSGDIWHYQYDKKKKKGLHTRIIVEDAVCASPVLLDNGDILYCCRGAIKRYHAATKERTVLIGDGYCVAPAYSPVGDKIAYAKRVKQQMEIFVYDMKTKRHEQMTFACNSRASSDYNAQKTDPCWAPDGIHVAFCWERSGESRIGLMNTLRKEYQLVTPQGEFCSYPAWSGNLACSI